MNGEPRTLARRTFLKGALATGPLLMTGSSLLAPSRVWGATLGPSTATQPYLRPAIGNVDIIPVLTVGDSIGGTGWSGFPTGLGAFRSGPKEFTLLMNHEITAQRPGIVRAHGSNGAFVSRWTIDAETLAVKHGQDHTTSPRRA